MPPSIGFQTPNPKIGFGKIPFFVNTELRPWDEFKEVRRVGVSAFGFGGTNFHAVLEEHVPGESNDGIEPRWRCPQARRRRCPAAWRWRTRRRFAARCCSARVRRRSSRSSSRQCSRKRRPGMRPIASPQRPGPRRQRADCHRFRRCRRACQEGDERAQRASRGQRSDLEGAQAAGDLPSDRRGAQDGVPLHRAGLSVCEHAARDS